MRFDDKLESLRAEISSATYCIKFSGRRGLSRNSVKGTNYRIKYVKENLRFVTIISTLDNKADFAALTDL